MPHNTPTSPACQIQLPLSNARGKVTHKCLGARSPHVPNGVSINARFGVSQRVQAEGIHRSPKPRTRNWSCVIFAKFAGMPPQPNGGCVVGSPLNEDPNKVPPPNIVNPPKLVRRFRLCQSGSACSLLRWGPQPVALHCGSVSIPNQTYIHVCRCVYIMYKHMVNL